MSKVILEVGRLTISKMIRILESWKLQSGDLELVYFNSEDLAYLPVKDNSYLIDVSHKDEPVLCIVDTDYK